MNFFDKTKRCVPFLKSVRHFAMITQTREQSAYFNWLKATNTRLPIVHTSNTSLPTRKKLVKKLARIEASSICRQQFADLFADCFCAVHTHQLEFANTSLPTLVCRVKAALGFVCARAHVRALMTRKSCAVGMRNAIKRNYLNTKLYIHNRETWVCPHFSVLMSMFVKRQNKEQCKIKKLDS